VAIKRLKTGVKAWETKQFASEMELLSRVSHRRCGNTTDGHCEDGPQQTHCEPLFVPFTPCRLANCASPSCRACVPCCHASAAFAGCSPSLWTDRTVASCLKCARAGRLTGGSPADRRARSSRQLRWCGSTGCRSPAAWRARWRTCTPSRRR
jgi:hypothetical protein